MPDGRKEIEAEELSFAGVTRHHSGTYECVANNGHGQVRHRNQIDYLQSFLLKSDISSNTQTIPYCNF